MTKKLIHILQQLILYSLSINNLKYFIISLTFFCCACQNNSIILEPIISDEYVYIKKSYLNIQEDSLILNFPLEYKIANNSSKEIDNLNILITHNGNVLNYLDDFTVFDKNKHYRLTILETKRKIKPREELHIIIKENYIYVSRKDAENFFVKYKIDPNLLKIKKEIQIVNFKKFRKENLEIMNKIRKCNDSILLSTFNKGKLILINREKINW